MNWLGVEVLKYPTDLLVYLEIIHGSGRSIIETGTHQGGSALFFASILDLIGRGQVISIDCGHAEHPAPHPRITYLVGSSTSEDVWPTLPAAEGLATVLVTLDSSTRNGTLPGDRRLSPLRDDGELSIVEDTKLNGHPVFTR